MASVRLMDVCKSFDAVSVIEHVSLQVAHGEFIALVGPSGSGKSTLLRMIAGLETVTAGTIEIDGQVVNDIPPKQRDIAMVFQNYALYPHMTVAQNLAFALKMRKTDRAEIDRRIADVAASLNLETLLDRYPRQLSGGQRQRVATGRAIVRDPQVFLFDEPLSNLDAKLRVQVRAELRQLHRRLGVTALYVTHDQVEAMTMADRIVVLHNGRIEQVGAPLELYDRPANTFVATFIGSPAMNLIPGQCEGEMLLLANGSRIAVPAGLLVNAPVTIGVRPEHIDLAPAGDATVPARVSAVEPTGAETVVTADLAGGAVTLVTRERVAALPGDIIHLRLSPERLLAYDASGRRITPAREG